MYILGTKGLLPQISMGTHLSVDIVKIDPTDNIKNLDVYFDKHMTFEKHRQNWCKNLSYNNIHKQN